MQASAGPRRFRPLALLAPLALSACVIVRTPGMGEDPGGGAAHVVPASVHLERGHIFAEAFIEAGDREDITMTVEGAGASSNPVRRRCRFLRELGAKRALLDCSPLEHITQINMWEPRWLESQSVPVDPKQASGAYVLRFRAGDRVVAEHKFSLASVPTVGGEKASIVAPSDRPSTIVFDGKGAYAWLRVDGRAGWGKHYMRFAWFKDGALAHSQDAEFQPRFLAKRPTQGDIELDSPVVDVRPFALELPKEVAGKWTVVALLDGDVPFGSWDLTVNGRQLEGSGAQSFAPELATLPVGWISGSPDAPAALVELAKKEHHIGPPSKPLAEPMVCVYAFEKDGRTIAEQQAKLSGADWALLGIGSAAYQEEYDKLARSAAAQGRITDDGKHVWVTQGELDRAGQRGHAGAAGSDAARKKVAAEQDGLAKRLRELAKKYKPGCLREGLAGGSSG